MPMTCHNQKDVAGCWKCFKDLVCCKKCEILSLTQEMEEDDILCLLYDIAEQNDVIIVQAFNSEHLDGAVFNAKQIHKAIGNSGLLDDLNDKVKEIIREVDADNEVDYECEHCPHRHHYEDKCPPPDDDEIESE